jgi:hypothetical protein
MRHVLFAALAATLMNAIAAAPAFGGEADVIDVRHEAEPGGTWFFEVTVRHADDGWDHYADKWQVTGADGTVFGERILAHPHVDEQPFTRSQGGIRIPDGVREVTVRAQDSVHGWGGAEVKVVLAGH